MRREIRFMTPDDPGVFEVINVRYFGTRVRTFQFSTAGEHICKSRPAVNRPLTGRARRRTGRSADYSIVSGQRLRRVKVNRVLRSTIIIISSSSSSSSTCCCCCSSLK